MTYKPLTFAQRALLIGVGTTSLGFGIAGMFLPGIPTTPFLLITVGCYARSSERLYTWVLTRPWLQKPLATAFRFKERRALPLQIKLIAQGVAWSSFGLAVFTSPSVLTQLSTLLLAIACSVAMGVIKTDDEPLPERRWQPTLADIAAQLGLGALAGGFGGLMWGLAARASAQFAANLTGLPVLIDLPALLGLGAGLGALLGLAYVGLRHWLPANKWLRSAAFSALSAPVLLYAIWQLQAGSLLGVAWSLPSAIAYGLLTSLAFGRLAGNRAPAQAALAHSAAGEQNR
jgi:uncharacterized membrane protein YbaN (DUF454 family)